MTHQSDTIDELMRSALANDVQHERIIAILTQREGGRAFIPDSEVLPCVKISHCSDANEGPGFLVETMPSVRYAPIVTGTHLGKSDS